MSTATPQKRKATTPVPAPAPVAKKQRTVDVFADFLGPKPVVSSAPKPADSSSDSSSSSDAAEPITSPLLFLGLADDADDTTMTVFRGSVSQCERVLGIINVLRASLNKAKLGHGSLAHLFKALSLVSWYEIDDKTEFTMNPFTQEAYHHLLAFTKGDNWIVHTGTDIAGNKWIQPYAVVTFEA
jgi:hypothetical protein